MRFEKRWCSGCSFLVYDPHACPNKATPTQAELPIAFQTIAVRERRPELMLLPITCADVAGLSVVTIVVESWVPFKPRRLHVAPEIASYFDMLDLRFGNVSKFANVGAVPASCFIPPTDVRLEKLERVPFDNIAGMSVIPVGQGIVLQVQNRASHPLSFRAMMAGDMIC